MNLKQLNCHVIGIDLAKHSFAVHGADAQGHPLLRTTWSRSKLRAAMAELPACRVYMEACGGAHYWGREFTKMGHDVGLLPPVYVKPFVKRQKNDANDAAAIVEAGSRPTMRVVQVKSAATQALGMLYRARELLTRQRTQTANSIRGMLTEFGITVAKGLWNVTRLREIVDEQGSALPAMLHAALQPLFESMAQCDQKIDALTATIKRHVAASAEAQRLMTIPGIGPITAYAMLALVSDFHACRKGREFAAWVGLTPKEHSTGGRHWSGAITKMGQRDLRRLLTSGALAVIQQAARKDSSLVSPWLQRMLANRPRKLVASALANRMARVAWAVMVHQQPYDATKSRIG